VIDDPLLPPVGVVPTGDGQACWRVWAPKAKSVELVLDPDGTPGRVPMRAEERGYFACETERPKTGRRYAYSLDGGPPRPDPLSRWQPDGVFGPSAVFHPEQLAWDEPGWRGIRDRRDLVFYELHVGTFTPEGTFDAVIPRLGDLVDLGITAVELMPVGQFPGARGWGYDGVLPFAPQHSYGGPEGLKRLVEACHRAGLAVFLDVVYNHFGPEGNGFPDFGHYFNDRYRTDWGSAVNFDGYHADPVRAMVLDNVRMWIRDYRFDGLRLDAADQIYDRGPSNILAEIAEVAHREAEAAGRVAHVFAETDLNNAQRFLRDPERGGFGHDGHWNDDFHHAAHVALTGDATGYFMDFAPGAEALAKVYSSVFVDDGVYSRFRDRRHGAPATEFPGDRFLAFTQNHDQVANGNAGRRHAAVLPASATRLAAGILLLAPRLPMLFQGEEYGETNPFPYFCDLESLELREAVQKGRAAEFAYFGRTEPPPDPLAASTRDLAVLSWDWGDPARAGLRRLYRDLLRLRRESATLRDFRHGASWVLGPGDVIEVVRGGVEPDPTPALRIFFNLGDEDRPLPEGLAAELPAFRSEVAAYGANESEADRRFTRLRPHEFAIFGDLGASAPGA
jgi:maltooligosyltrehalose trehalohydrolase